MTNKMKAAVLHEFGQDLKIEEVDIPTVGAGQILVKMEASIHSLINSFLLRP